MKTTPKMLAFIQGKAAGLNHQDAMIGAGYSPGGARQAAVKLLAKPEIKSAIAKAKRELSKAKHPSADAPDEAPKYAMPRKNYSDPKQFLEDAMNNEALPIMARADFAHKLMPYTHARIGEAGKKEKTKDRAKEIAKGRFAPKEAPRRHVN